MATIELLREENQALTEENEKLRLQLNVRQKRQRFLGLKPLYEKTEPVVSLSFRLLYYTAMFMCMFLIVVIVAQGLGIGL